MLYEGVCRASFCTPGALQTGGKGSNTPRIAPADIDQEFRASEALHDASRIVAGHETSLRVLPGVAVQRQEGVVGALEMSGHVAHCAKTPQGHLHLSNTPKGHWQPMIRSIGV